MTHANLATRTLQPLRLLLYVSPLLVLLLLVPYVTNPYQTFLLSYGLVMAIAALGFNLLLGYTGLLSFGHSAYFGVGAYAVAFMVKYLHITSMELFLLGGVLATAVVTALFGFVCVRYTRIFFSILTMVLSQVLWSLAYKFFWAPGVQTVCVCQRHRCWWGSSTASRSPTPAKLSPTIIPCWRFSCRA